MSTHGFAPSAVTAGGFGKVRATQPNQPNEPKVPLPPGEPQQPGPGEIPTPADPEPYPKYEDAPPVRPVDSPPLAVRNPVGPLGFGRASRGVAMRSVWVLGPLVVLSLLGCRTPLPPAPDQPATQPTPDAGLPGNEEPQIEPDTGSPLGPGGLAPTTGIKSPR